MIEVKSQEILLTVDGATLRVGVTYHTPMVMAELPEIRLEVVGDGSPLIPVSQVDEAIGFSPSPCPHATRESELERKIIEIALPEFERGRHAVKTFSRVAIEALDKLIELKKRSEELAALLLSADESGWMPPATTDALRSIATEFLAAHDKEVAATALRKAAVVAMRSHDEFNTEGDYHSAEWWINIARWLEALADAEAAK